MNQREPTFTRQRRQAGTLARWLLPVALLSAIALLVACAPEPAPEPAAPTKAAPAAKTAAPSSKATPAPKTKAPEGPSGRVVASINPHVSTVYEVHQSGTAGQSAQFWWPIYDGLVWVDREGQVNPGLAESWETEDAVTWTFNLRDDVTFHDGSALTAEDVVGSFEAYQDPEIGQRMISLFADVETIEAVDDQTVEITLKRPYPAFVKLIALALVFDASEVESQGFETIMQNPNGTGPYRFVNFQQQERLEFEAMPADFVSPRGPAGVEELLILAIPEEATRASAIRTGEIDIGYPINSPDLVNGLEAEGFNVKIDPGSAQIHLTFDMSQPPMNDLRVRHALNMAVNREAILENVLGGFGELDGQLIGEEVLGYNDDIEPYPYDQDRARELLAEAGYADGFSTTIRYTQSLGDDVASAIAADLAQVGVEAELQRIESSVWLPEYRGTQDQRPGLWMGVTNWEQTFEADPVWRWWTADFPLDGGRRWDGPEYEEFNEIYQRAKTTVDEEERDQIYQEAAAYLHEQAPVLFLWRFGRPAVHNDRVEWTPGLFADQWTTQIEVLD